ncbi:tetratricopeptide repeat protein [Clostridium weizhouense]|uniref:Tetratricopeptide repeat protein n=1 Tax=Clostridium weizhouense TaxID=2859781 RepID=A0ABS7AQU3_9CLOT|nr:hypothetical protein [Clostridium weizhouense]MBW6410428.1 hypothetical protein [Clostridium weizhouense]
MDKKCRKLYNKAIKYYQTGEINKALEICEEALAYSLKNSSILNLKGILLYQKGNLDGAITVWKINKDFNDDGMAKNYLKDTQEDKRRSELYLLGEKRLKDLNIDDAINIFKQCLESDFNSIKVNTALALCYQKKGDFTKCINHMEKVLSLDKKSKIANQIKKELIEVKAYKGSNHKLWIPITSMIILSIIVTITYSFYNGSNINKESSNNSIESLPNNTLENTKDNAKEEVIEKEVIEEENISDVTKKNSINVDKLKEALDKNDLDTIYSELDNVNENDIDNNNKGMYRNAIDILKTTGVEKFYEKAMNEFNLKNYENANIEFQKAYKYCEGSYLKEHIIFYKAVTLENVKNNEDAIKTYDEYYGKYPKGEYADNALYNAAMLTKETNKDKSLYYANKLEDNFPNSIYFNQNILNILNK